MLEPGARVEIGGLGNRPELNGKHAKLVSHDEASDMWVVVVEGGERLKIKAGNLVASLPVDTSRARDKFWLAKVPRFLMDHWQKLQAEQSDATLGVVEPSGGEASSSSYTLRLSAYAGHDPELAEASASLPQEFAMSTSAPPAAMYALARPPAGQRGPVQLEGGVEAMSEITVTRLTGEYKRRVAQRKDEAARRAEVEVVADDRDIRAHSLKRIKPRPRAERGAPKPEKPDLSEDELVQMIFTLFRRQPYWHRKDLMEEVGPIQRQYLLTQALDKVCEREKIGAHKGEYVLKAEYKQQ